MSQTSPRHHVDINGIALGGSAPVVVQSMTNTDTADIEATVAQVQLLYDNGSELVRITVNNDEAARAVPHIVDKLAAQGIRFTHADRDNASLADIGEIT